MTCRFARVSDASAARDGGSYNVRRPRRRQSLMLRSVLISFSAFLRELS